MPERATRQAAFLTNLGIDPSSARLLAGDASNRRYFRTSGGILMDAPPELEDVRPFCRVARHLRKLGLSAPAVLAADPDDGWLLLEDLGDALFSRILADGARPNPLYGAAVDLLVRLARQPAPEWLDQYDLGPLHAEANLFLDWYLPAAGIRLDARARNAWRDVWTETLASHLPTAPVLVLRDCHVDNLIWLPGRPPPGNVGLLDFQDALAGHPAYDLASLLDDVRRPMPQGLVANLLARYLEGTELEEADFFPAFATLSAQRSTKILGIFARLAQRDGKPQYLAWLPSAWRMLELRIAHRSLVTVRTWFNRYVPTNVRQPGALTATADADRNP